MKGLPGIYANPFTDYGFKRIFGEEVNKDLLIDFLNELLPENQGKIVDLTYLRSDKLGKTQEDRSAVFDLYCKNEKEERFIVELQKSKQVYFKDRTLYYSTFPVQEQGEKGEWDYLLQAVYTIGILDFEFDEHKHERDKLMHTVKLMDVETKDVFYDKFTFIYLETPKFTKREEELETHFEKWLYLLRNLSILDRIPGRLREKIFEKVFKTAEIAKFNKEEVMEYQSSLKQYRDLKNSIETARIKGLKEGLKEGELIGIEKGKQIGIEQGKQLGIEEGLEKGLEKGKQIGIEQGLEKGLEQGKQMGIEQGKEVGKIEGQSIEKAKIAKNLKNLGIEIRDIVGVTGLSVEEIEKL